MLKNADMLKIENMALRVEASTNEERYKAAVSTAERWRQVCEAQAKLIEQLEKERDTGEACRDSVRLGRWVDEKGNPLPWDEEEDGCPRGSAHCSLCGEWLVASDEYRVKGKYCTNCGAKMEKNLICSVVAPVIGAAMTHAQARARNAAGRKARSPGGDNGLVYR